MFQENNLTLGLFFPLESYEGSIPEMNILSNGDILPKPRLFDIPVLVTGHNFPALTGK
jgi:hypothetical protein